MSMHVEPEAASAPPSTSRRFVPWVIGGATLVVALVVLALVLRAESTTNRVALAAVPKPVTAVHPTLTSYRGLVRLIGTVEAWQSARISPQLVSAYVSTVLVRPGDHVKRGDVLATLDCKNANYASQGAAAQAKILQERAQALARETARFEEMGQGGYVSANELEQRRAQTASTVGQIEAQRAQIGSRGLEVSDCVLRAPFEGEVGARLVDPGAFVRPGMALVTVVDRRMLRVTAEAPETALAAAAPGTPAALRFLATGKQSTAPISRRAPSADPQTRSVHFEIDLESSKLDVPVGTTVEIKIEVGTAEDAIELPLLAASVRENKAVVFLVEGDVAKKRSLKVLGERGGSLFLERGLGAEAQVVTEGRSTLADGDKVFAKLATAAPVAKP